MTKIVIVSKNSDYIQNIKCKIWLIYNIVFKRIFKYETKICKDLSNYCTGHI